MDHDRSGAGHIVHIAIVGEDARSLSSYAAVSIAYRIEQIVDVDTLVATAGARVESRPVETPYLKDYDAYPGNSPLNWPKRFDLSKWTFFGVYSDDRRVAGAAVATRDRGIELLENRDDVSLLYDVRVDPEARRHGVGTLALTAAESWARQRSMRRLLAETQDVNVAACRFYSKHGFRLDAANRGAYPDLPGETQLIWYRDLA